MPAENILVLAAILFAFALFGAILAASDFYSRNGRPRPGNETK